MPERKEPTLERMERSAQRMAKIIDEALNGPERPRHTGFVLFMFDFGEGGFSTFVSNGERESTAAALRELFQVIDPETEEERKALLAEAKMRAAAHIPFWDGVVDFLESIGPPPKAWK